MALAAALRTIYKRRGFRILSKQIPGALATDPFREGLGNAVLWFSNLQDQIKARLEAALAAADTVLFPPTPSPPSSMPPPPAPPPPPSQDRPLPSSTPPPSAPPSQTGSAGRVSRVLPSGPPPPSLSAQPPLLAQPPLSTHPPPTGLTPGRADRGRPLSDGGDVQFGADGCFSYRHVRSAGDGPISHDPQYFISKDKVNKATILEAYNVGCVADNSFNMFSILSEGLHAHVGFIINAMHAYSHQWICQLVYSPRLRRGAGLSDHKGVEHIWSRIRRLIPLTRHQWKSRRIWTLDQYMAFVNDEGRDGLGTWIERQRKNLTKKQSGALKVLRECQIPESELCLQWQAQKAAQTSVRSYAPTRLRHELEKIIALQTQIDAVEKSIAEAKASITSAGASTHSITLLKGLEATHETLSSQADALYTSLNIHGVFPELKDLPLEEAPGTKMYQATSKAIAKRQSALLRSVAKFNRYCAALEDLQPAMCDISIPPPLATDLTGLCNDPYLQQDVWMAPSGGAPPRWLSDENEAVRLNAERKNLRSWLDEELNIITHAMLVADAILEHPLREREEQLKNMVLTWEFSIRHIDTPVSAASTATTATSSSTPTPSSMLTATSTAVSPSNNIPLGDVFPARISQRATNATVTAEVELEADDLFEGGDMAGDDLVASEELDPGVDSEDEVLYVEEAIRNMSCDAEDDTSAITNQPVLYEIRWDCPDNVRIDHSLLQDLKARNQFFEPINRTSTFAHIVAGTEGQLKQTIEDTDLAPLRHPTSLLNNFCINGLAAALLEFCTHNMDPTAAGVARQCAVLTTHELPRYWEKAVWIVPVHRLSEKHWVLIIVMPHEESMYFFDSMNGENWRPDLRLMMVTPLGLRGPSDPSLVLHCKPMFTTAAFGFSAPWLQLCAGMLLLP
ncbi:hypothetical protein DFH07DRAFT_966042 [Mycena maculata]|uniref:Ubiquitin-like protease family profile domain-containing protein n=1 Tax=Mycena maculata TaxID=230809 RepID=A0AAD7IA29_9AGAR|nr:hypothetical protein DFH07DRAFT_966042 [Mycena maculata]